MEMVEDLRNNRASFPENLRADGARVLGRRIYHGLQCGIRRPSQKERWWDD
ncbi:MAG: hypothetical protein CM15mP48_2960 [Candidatus Poseidoniales archaeon]|nr:MAG: hypothetical protein CM15mP48_2960 [Candidatus Poseidoniales archaeon]